MKKLINLLNWLTDMDWGWWPLIKYRPAKHEYLDSNVLIKITPFFGTVTGLVVVALTNKFDSPLFILMSVAICWPIFFVLYRATFSVAWNIRADNIKNFISSGNQENA